MKIAIVKLSALGDIIHAMVILQFIKKYNRAIEIDWIVEESYKELLELNPDINKVHVLNIRKAKKKKSIHLFLTELKNMRKLGPYDLVIDMQGLIKSALISSLIPSQTTLGFDKFSARESIASIFYNKTFNYGYDKNIVERNVALVGFALGLNIGKKNIDNKLPFLFSTQKYINPKLSSEKKNILLVPGASLASKRYSVAKFSELTNLIDANYFVIWGNEKEKDLANKIKTLAQNVNICDNLSLDNLISLITKADLIIGPDTGPTHMGWALNIPSITLFGSTPGHRNTYETKLNKIINSDSIVNPLKINKNDHSVSEIDVHEIVKIATLILSNFK